MHLLSNAAKPLTIDTETDYFNIQSLKHAQIMEPFAVPLDDADKFSPFCSLELRATTTPIGQREVNEH